MKGTLRLAGISPKEEKGRQDGQKLGLYSLKELGSNPDSALSSCVTLGKLLDLSEPQGFL